MYSKKKLSSRKALFRKSFQVLSAAAAAVCLCIGAAGAVAYHVSPNSLRVTEDSGISISQSWYQVAESRSEKEKSVSASSSSPHEAEVRLLGVIPIKKVSLKSIEQPYAAVSGIPFGIRMEAKGVVVVGTADITSNGKSTNPASEAGLKIGDVIYKVNGQEVSQNSELAEIFEASAGKPVSIEAQRGGEDFTAVLQPAFSETDGLYKGGLWVRDSTSGIGTLTFWDPESNTFGGLGHGICDVDTDELMPLGSGEILPVTISGVIPGKRGNAGELQGYFSSDVAVGKMSANTETGVYGTFFEAPSQEKTIPIAMKQEVRAGEAQILTTIDGGEPQYYDAVIESVNYDENRQTKNLIIRVTDKELLQKTGGIVQGMSGSPIVQNGRLVGAVTHVLINTPEKGYGIFAENMLETANSLTGMAG